jgi:hypothetical protein
MERLPTRRKGGTPGSPEGSTEPITRTREAGIPRSQDNVRPRGLGVKNPPAAVLAAPHRATAMAAEEPLEEPFEA